MRKTVWFEPMTNPKMFSVQYYDPETGKHCRITTYSTDERERKIHELEGMFLNYQRGNGDPDALPSIVFEKYLTWCAENGRRPGTIDLKRRAVTPFLIRVRRMGAVEKDTIEDWKSAMTSKYKNDTVSIRLRELRNFLNWTVKKKYIVKNPMEEISVPSSTFEGRRLTDDELSKLFTHCSDEFRPFFILLRETGARNGDVRLMDWSEVDFTNACWTVPVGEGRKTKVKRFIPLSDCALGALRERLKGQKGVGRVFDGWTPFKVQYHWGQMCVSAGVEGRIRPHDVRHTFASRFRGRQSELKAVCGWSTDVMANKYSHVVIEEIRDGMKKSGMSFGADLGRSGNKDA